MEPPQSPLVARFGKNMTSVYIAAIGYLLGTNHQLQKQYAAANSRADRYEAKIEKFNQDRINASDKLTFRYMVQSDSAYIVDSDTVLRIPFLTDTGNKKTAP